MTHRFLTLVTGGDRMHEEELLGRERAANLEELGALGGGYQRQLCKRVQPGVPQK